MTAPPPLLLLLGPAGHGVTAYGADVASAVRRADDRTRIRAASSASDAIALCGGEPRVHAHITDRILGSSPEDAAENLVRLAATTRLTVTVHDLPQTSDGTMMSRRVEAYARFLDTAEAAVVNSEHERLLVGEFLPRSPTPAAIPLGARTATAPHLPRDTTATRDLVVLIAGYFYPGKGHAVAVHAAAAAAAALRHAGESVGDVVVRGIGRPSPGHGAEAEQLRRDAAGLGVRLELTGFLDDESFGRALAGAGIPLAGHEHVSASRSMLDWVEAGRRPLVADSRYAAEMDELRPGTLQRCHPDELAQRLVLAWREPGSTWLSADVVLHPDLDDVAAAYLEWWRERAG